MATILAGVAFGAALAASRVYQPTVIISQFTLDDWHMMQAFLTAAASSALYISAARKLSDLNLQPRSASSLGLFGKYDGNIVGGLLLGAGMGMSGACPGTVFAQVGMGIRSGVFALGGSILAGIIWSGLLQPALSRRRASLEQTGPEAVHESLGVSRETVLFTFEIACAGFILLSARLTSPIPGTGINPVLGGAFIGGAQLISMMLRRSLLGTSTSFSELGDWFWWSASFDKKTKTPGSKNIMFATSVAGGAWLASGFMPSFRDGQSLVNITPLAASVGGSMMTIGARIAGGCTSGHGISGMGLLSTSSLITVASMFGSGIAVAKMMY